MQPITFGRKKKPEDKKEKFFGTRAEKFRMEAKLRRLKREEKLNEEGNL